MITRTAHEAEVRLERGVLPLLLTIWFVAYLDRFNIGYAALQMNTALRLSPAAFGFGAGLFFFAYSLFEIPSNLALTRVGARRWLARIMFTWGVASMATAFANGREAFYVCRFLLGAAEAGCFPGIAYYLSQHLSASQRTYALAQLASVTQVAIMAGGPIAALLLRLDGVFGLAGWKWLFIVEGLPAIALAVVVLTRLPDASLPVSDAVPSEHASRTRLAALDTREERLMEGLRSAIADPRMWGWAAVFFSYNVGSSALRVWQPMMIKTLGHTSDSVASLLTIVPAIAGFTAILVVGRHAARRNELRWHAAVPMMLGGAGLVSVAFATTAIHAVAATALAALAVACQPIIFSAVAAATSNTERAAAVAFVNSIAMLGSFFGPSFVGIVEQATGGGALAYLTLGMLVVSGGLLHVAIPLISVQTHRRQTAPATSP